MQVPDDLRYTEEHEWVRMVDGDRVRIGITDYAQDALGDIVYVDLPETGARVEQGAVVAEVESTKSVGEVYAPFAGTVAAVNTELQARPELVNSSPYDEGWMVELEPEGGFDPGSLLDAAAYRRLTEG